MFLLATFTTDSEVYCDFCLALHYALPKKVIVTDRYEPLLLYFYLRDQILHICIFETIEVCFVTRDVAL